MGCRRSLTAPITDCDRAAENITGGEAEYNASRARRAARLAGRRHGDEEVRMGLKIRKEQGIPVVELSGEFWGGKETKEVAEKVRGLLESGEKGIILDTHDVRHLNSTAIGDIVGLRTSALNRGGELVMVYGQGSKIRHLLVVIKLEFLFKPFASVEEAVQYFKNSPKR
jgi:anti-anti-sigma factor